MLSQMIFTSTSAPHVTLADKINVAAYSVVTSQRMGLTGRVLVVPDMAINVFEGPGPILKAYVEAIKNDLLIDILIVHRSQPIEEREFEDYSVWMTYKTAIPMEGVYRLTADNVKEALPKTLSVKTRLFIDANFGLTELAA